MINKFETSKNKSGLTVLSGLEDFVLAFPYSKDKGSVQIELLTKKESRIIKCHETSLIVLSLNLNGTLLATASEMGTLIKVFDTSNGKKIHEFRTSSNKSTIYSITFSNDSKFICTSSDKGTIHVFCLGKDGEKQNSSNRTSK